MNTDVTLSVCETCGYDAERPTADRPGATLAALFESSSVPGIRVERTRCLMSCERPCALALQCHQKYSYVLCDLPADNTTVEALAAFSERYASSSDGTVAWKNWPEVIKGRFAARIPWLNTTDETDQ